MSMSPDSLAIEPDDVMSDTLGIICASWLVVSATDGPPGNGYRDVAEPAVELVAAADDDDTDEVVFDADDEVEEEDEDDDVDADDEPVAAATAAAAAAAAAAKFGSDEFRRLQFWFKFDDDVL